MLGILNLLSNGTRVFGSAKMCSLLFGRQSCHILKVGAYKQGSLFYVLVLANCCNPKRVKSSNLGNVSVISLTFKFSWQKLVFKLGVKL